MPRAPAYAPEFTAALAPYLPMLQARPKAAVHDIQTRRDGVDALFGVLFANTPDAPGVVVQRHSFPSYDGAAITVVHTARDSALASPTPTAAILHAHGGGMIVGSLELWVKRHPLLVADTGVQVFSVDYRIAPEWRHPTLVEDVYAGLKWLSGRAAEFNVDPARIAIMGESAGGGIAAGVALMARDRGLSPPLAKQILIYPMLDDRNTVANEAIEPLAVWRNDDNVTGWTALLGQEVVGKDEAVSEYAAPARAKNLDDLPPTYIDVGELDIFRAEDIEYAARLARSNTNVEFHLYPGVPHAWEALSPDISVTKRALENRRMAIMEI